MEEISGALKIIEFGFAKLNRETQIRALTKVEVYKLECCLRHYEALEEFEICEILNSVIEAKRFNPQIPWYSRNN